VTLRLEETDMRKTPRRQDRLSINIDPEEHIKIKIIAAVRGKTIKEFVLESVRERVRQEMESSDLKAMTGKPAGALWELWDNEKDSGYDSV
jgi:uncharacterized protein (DUF1778 family)